LIFFLNYTLENQKGGKNKKMIDIGKTKVARVIMKRSDFIDSTPEGRHKVYEFLVGHYLEELIKIKNYENIKEIQIKILLQGE
jgi:hypothetical protein